MNSGGEPERDDTGLPPVDIEIPDDARELDRDVQAYYRELRAERRRQRRGRLHGSLGREGVVLPLLACCLILALITGTLLTVFTATSDQNLGAPPGYGTNTGLARGGSPSSVPGHTTPGAGSSGSSSRARATSPSASSPATPASGGTGAGGTAAPTVTKTSVRLRAASLLVGGQPKPLKAMIGTMLVLIPPNCHCTAAVSRLTRIGARATAQTLLVGTPDTFTEAKQLESRLNPSIETNVMAALDLRGVLQTVVSASGLTVVVISGQTNRRGRQPVAYVSNLTASNLTASGSSLSAALSKALPR